MDTYSEVERGREAQKIIESQIYQEAFASVREAVTRKWRESALNDTAGMYELKVMDKVLSLVNGYLTETMQTGKMADIQLERDNKIASLRKAGIR